MILPGASAAPLSTFIQYTPAAVTAFLKALALFVGQERVDFLLEGVDQGTNFFPMTGHGVLELRSIIIHDPLNL